MSSFEIHQKKHELFRRDAQDKNNSHMTRIDAYFESCFHLIDACAALFDVHINKHQEVRKVIEENEEIFGKDTQLIWNKFQELENKIRPGQAYGGRIDGEQLKKAEDISKIIFGVCNAVIRKKNLAKGNKNSISQEESHENAKRI